MARFDVDALSEKDAYALQAFRRAAGEVHRFWWPWRDHQFKVTVMATNQPDGGDFIPESDFRALAIAVRLVYLDKKEASSFENVSRVLRGLSDPDIADALDRIEKDWNGALEGRGGVTHHDLDRTFSPRDVLDTWLYALTFHQNQRKQRQAEALRRFGPTATFTLQMLVSRLAVTILNLDSAVAYALGEDHRIGVAPAPRDPRAGLF